MVGNQRANMALDKRRKPSEGEFRQTTADFRVKNPKGELQLIGLSLYLSLSCSGLQLELHLLIELSVCNSLSVSIF